MSETIESGSLLERPRFVDRLEDCFFYHAMELPGFGLVRAHWDLRGRFEEYVGGVEVAGKSVLDIGAATGFLSFEAEKRGAVRVLSFDMSDARQQTFLPFKDKLYYRDPERWAEVYGAELEQWKNAYWLCHRLLESKAEVYYGNVYDLPRELGKFDVAILGSVLEHLSDQITALAFIAKCLPCLGSASRRLVIRSITICMETGSRRDRRSLRCETELRTLGECWRTSGGKPAFLT